MPTIRRIAYFTAQIHINGKKIHIGIYDTPVKAANAYDEKAKEFHGEYAILNFGIKPSLPITEDHKEVIQNEIISETGFYGVYKERKTIYGKKYLAKIKVNKKVVPLGYFDDPKDAAIAYDSAAIIHFGQFARLNFKEIA